jgi:WD40 repeat protein
MLNKFHTPWLRAIACWALLSASVAEGQEVVLATAKKGGASRLAVSGPGDYIATSGGSIHIWGSKSGRELMALDRFPGLGSASDIVFCPDTDRLRLVHLQWEGTKRKGSVRTWKWKETKPWSPMESLVSTLFLPPGVFFCRFSPDGRYLVAAYREERGRKVTYSVKLFDLEKEKLETLFGDDPAYATALCFSPRTATLAVALDNGDVRLWEVAAKKEIKRFTPRNAPVFGLAFSPDEERLACGGMERMISVWDLTKVKEITSFEADLPRNNCLAFAPDGKDLFVGTSRYIQVWTIADGEATQKPLLGRHSAPIRAMIVCPPAGLLITACDDGDAKLWVLPPSVEKE